MSPKYDDDGGYAERERSRKASVSIEELDAIRLRKGEVVLVRTTARRTASQRAQDLRKLRAAFAGHEVVMLRPGDDVEVVAPGQPAERRAMPRKRK